MTCSHMAAFPKEHTQRLYYLQTVLLPSLCYDKGHLPDVSLFKYYLASKAQGDVSNNQQLFTFVNGSAFLSMGGMPVALQREILEPFCSLVTLSLLLCPTGQDFWVQQAIQKKARVQLQPFSNDLKPHLYSALSLNTRAAMFAQQTDGECRCGYWRS
ncbi:hypothetical protein STEG23_027221 [Scotinomys teguina]